MTKLNTSFVNSLKSALNDTRFSAKDFVFQGSASSNKLIDIAFKYNNEYSFSITEETETEIVTEKNSFAVAALGTTERKNTSLVNYIYYSPGEYKKKDKIAIYDIGESSEHLAKWCRYIFNEISHMNEEDVSYDNLRDQIEELLKDNVENENEAFNDDELTKINEKFDTLANQFEKLKEENKITQAELNKVIKDFDEFKSSAQVLPKGLWARITNNKLVDIAVAFGKSKEGREFVIEGIKKLVS